MAINPRLYNGLLSSHQRAGACCGITVTSRLHLHYCSLAVVKVHGGGGGDENQGEIVLIVMNSENLIKFLKK